MQDILIDPIILNVLVPIILGLVSGYGGAILKLWKESEVRTRAGDFAAMATLYKLILLLGSAMPPGFNFTSTNTTHARMKQTVIDVNEKKADIVSDLFDSAARSDNKYRRELYAIAVRLQNLDPIHIVQLNIWLGEYSDLPPGGLREYLIGESDEREGERHNQVMDFQIFVDRFLKRMQEHHFGTANMAIYALTRIEDEVTNDEERLARRRAIREFISSLDIDALVRVNMEDNND